jgi:hypothetical protein
MKMQFDGHVLSFDSVVKGPNEYSFWNSGHLIAVLNKMKETLTIQNGDSTFEVALKTDLNDVEHALNESHIIDLEV